MKTLNKMERQHHYHATLAMDLPNGKKSGDTLELKGRTEFVIENGKIKTIRDYSNG